MLENKNFTPPSSPFAIPDATNRCRETYQSQRLLDTVEAIIVGLDTEGIVTLLSRRACKLLGYEKQALLGKSWFSTCLPQPEGMEIVYPAFQQLMAGQPQGLDYYENEVVTRSGERRMIAWRNSYMRDTEGNVIGSLSAGEDITERRQAEAALRQSEKRFRAIFEYSAVGIGMATPAGHIITSNTTLQSMLGYTGDELASMVFTEFIHPDDVEANMTLYRALLRGKRDHYSLEKRYLHKSGKIMWGRLHVSALRDERGKLQSVIGVMEDITERRQAEHALRKSEARLEHLLTSSPVVIYSSQPDGEYGATFVSENVIDQTGWETRRFIADSAFWFNHIHPDDKLRIRNEVARVFTSGKHNYEYRFLHKSGNYRWMHDEVKLFRDADGNPLELIGSRSDVTQRKLAEEQTATLLEENRRLMQRLFRIQETECRHLARELHDEFGQWICAVQAHAQTMLASDQLSLPDIQAGAQAIIKCMNEVQRGVHRMIKHLRPAVFDELGLEDSVRELVSQWRTQHPDVACKLSVAETPDDLDDTIGITIYRLIQEALTNVARHAHARHVAIILNRSRKLQSGAGSLQLSIADDGRGLPAKSNGGLGLLSMRERVLAAGGVYKLFSRPGKGIRIEAKLPIVQRQDNGKASGRFRNDYDTPR